MIETALNDKKYAGYSAIFFIEEKIIIKSEDFSPVLHFQNTLKQLKLTLEGVYLDGSLLIVKCRSALTHDQMLEHGFHIQSVKYFLDSCNEKTQQLIFRAVHRLTWEENSRYCSRCGAGVHRIVDTPEKKCGSCDLSFFSKYSPAIMVLIYRDNEILLARSANPHLTYYSALAGFIDMGETAENAVHREVREEVGLEISDLEYFGSQSWPFPDSFMIAFKAKYLRGEINIDKNEIADARWFCKKNLPELPPHASISRRLIDNSILKL